MLRYRLWLGLVVNIRVRLSIMVGGRLSFRFGLVLELAVGLVLLCGLVLGLRLGCINVRLGLG